MINRTKSRKENLLTEQQESKKEIILQNEDDIIVGSLPRKMSEAFLVKAFSHSGV